MESAEETGCAPHILNEKQKKMENKTIAVYEKPFFIETANSQAKINKAGKIQKQGVRQLSATTFHRTPKNIAPSSKYQYKQQKIKKNRTEIIFKTRLEKTIKIVPYDRNGIGL